MHEWATDCTDDLWRTKSRNRSTPRFRSPCHPSHLCFIRGPQRRGSEPAVKPVDCALPPSRHTANPDPERAFPASIRGLDGGGGVGGLLYSKRPAKRRVWRSPITEDNTQGQPNLGRKVTTIASPTGESWNCCSSTRLPVSLAVACRNAPFPHQLGLRPQTWFGFPNRVSQAADEDPCWSSRPRSASKRFRPPIAVRKSPKKRTLLQGWSPRSLGLWA